MTAQNEECATAADGERHLLPRTLLVLQLLARGYSRAQLAALLSVPAAEVARHERLACAALGAATVEHAVGLALRRRLIV